MKIMFTGGHSTPAFAVLDAVKELKGEEFDYLWISEKFNQRGSIIPSAEYITVTEKYKIPFINIRAGKLIRKWTRQTFLNGIRELFNLFIGFLQGFYYILKYKPDIVVSFGGFLAVPVVFWAKVFRKKVITHEQTIVTGLANKIISKFADKILVSWESSKKYFNEEKTIFTGNPVRKDIFKINSDITEVFPKDLPVIYITGGNQGANEINKRIFEILPEILELANVVHQTGNSSITNDYQKAVDMAHVLPEDLRIRYIVRDYVYKEEIGEVENKANLWISRAGANTITEMCVLAKPAILIPIPWASHDEQTKNAKMVEEIGLGMRLIQSDSLTPNLLLEHIKDALKLIAEDKGFDGNKLSTTIANKARALVNKDADKVIAEIVISELEIN